MGDLIAVNQVDVGLEPAVLDGRLDFGLVGESADGYSTIPSGVDSGGGY